MSGESWIDLWYFLGPYIALSVDMEMPAINKHPLIETIVYTGSIFCKVKEPWPNTCQTPATFSDLKKDIKENIDRYEDILNHLVGVSAAKPSKYDIEMDELTKNFEVMAQRRSALRGELKEAVPTTEDETNK